MIVKKKKKMNLPADHRVKLKENEKRESCSRTEKKNWNMKVTVILIVIGALGTVTNRLALGLGELEIRGHVETIQTTALLRSARILRRVLKT